MQAAGSSVVINQRRRFSINEFGAVTGRPRRCGWMDLPLLRYSNMINGCAWLVVTKLDVLDELAEIPVCTGYKLNGKKIEEIPAEAVALEKVECVYTKLPGWKKPTEGISEWERLAKKAQEYLHFLEAESGAKIGMISTGPDREQTIAMDDFAADMEINLAAASKRK